MLGTMCPSITSMCSSSAPAASTLFASLQMLARSLASIDGPMMQHLECGLHMQRHSVGGMGQRAATS